LDKESYIGSYSYKGTYQALEVTVKGEILTEEETSEAA
jgi:hypothetical protein